MRSSSWKDPKSTSARLLIIPAREEDEKPKTKEFKKLKWTIVEILKKKELLKSAHEPLIQMIG